MVMRSARVADWPAESATRTEKSELPAAEGVPEIVPVFEIDSPAGSAPALKLQEYGGVPPAPDNAWLYA